MVLVAAVDDEQVAHFAAQALEVRLAEFRPFGDEHQRVGGSGRAVGVVGEGEVAALLGGLGQGGAGGVLGDGVVGAHFGTRFKQRFDEVNARRFAHVVGAGFEGQSPDGDGFAFEVVAQFGAQFLVEAVFLVAVAGFDGVQDVRFVACAFGHADQCAHVFGEAGAAIARAGVDKARADARVAADAKTDVFDVHAEVFADARDFVHEGDAGGKHGVGGVFGHFGIAHVHGDEARALCGERGVERLHLCVRGFVVGADDDAVGVHEVLDGNAFFEEFGVGDDVVGDAFAARGEGVCDDGAHFFGGADGDGGFVDDDGRVFEVFADLPGDGEDVAEVCRAVFIRRGADGDAVDVRVVHRVRQAGGEVEAAFGVVFFDDGVKAGFVDGQDAVFEVVDFLRADVHAGDVVADVGEAAACDEADVSGADYYYVHGLLLGWV